VSQTPGRAPYYNVIAGQSLGRLSGISDGIFSVGMTLLVLGLTVPLATGIATEGDLANQLAKLLPNVVTYTMSFLTLGIFWVAQQTQFSQLKSSDRNYTWIHLGFLLAVTLVPFSTGLLAHFITFRLALLVYWLNIVILGFVLLAGYVFLVRPATEDSAHDCLQALGRGPDSLDSRLASPAEAPQRTLAFAQQYASLASCCGASFATNRSARVGRARRMLPRGCKRQEPAVRARARFCIVAI